MRISIAGAAIIAVIMSASAASAQFADTRSFFHPLGFWSNQDFVAQQRIYPPARKFDRATAYYVSPGTDWYGSGGGFMHERNW